MPSTHILRHSRVIKTPRVMQMSGIFDVPPSERSEEQWTVNLDLPEKWNIGLIVGPSGSGKSTVAREIFAEHPTMNFEWHPDKSILDCFPADMSIKEIVDLLSSVGFSSPPSWLRPFRVLSTGEQFRVTMARTLAEMTDLAVVDEFTSVVDRTVARIGSAAISKAVRRRNQKFVAVSCHYDICDWLEPDWVYQPHIDELQLGRHLWRRPSIELTIRRVHSSAWQLFRKHHYLDHEIHKSAICFVAFIENDIPAVFTSWVFFFGRRRGRREHRTVTLPDYQGVGMGNRVSDYIASMWRGLGMRVFSTTSHPQMIRSRNASLLWSLRRKSSLVGYSYSRKTKHACTRLTAGFEYVGPAMDRTLAEMLRGKSTS